MLLLALSALLIVGALAYSIGRAFRARGSALRASRHESLPPMIVGSLQEREVDIRPPARAAETVVMARPQTVDYLPGHLEVEVGSNAGEAIRFVQLRGEPADITLGRAEGPAYRHIRLPANTVSRTHARMQFEDGHWRITNLSQTNPTIVNGEELDHGSRGRWLRDGDRIQIGEMVLRFRAD